MTCTTTANRHPKEKHIIMTLYRIPYPAHHVYTDP